MNNETTCSHISERYLFLLTRAENTKVKEAFQDIIFVVMSIVIMNYVWQFVQEDKFSSKAKHAKLKKKFLIFKEQINVVQVQINLYPAL